MKAEIAPYPPPLPLPHTSYVVMDPSAEEILPFCSVMTLLDECHGRLERIVGGKGFPKM